MNDYDKIGIKDKWEEMQVSIYILSVLMQVIESLDNAKNE